MRKLATTSILIATLVCVAMAQTSAIKTGEGGKVTVSSRGDDVRAVIHDLFTQSGKNYILDPNVRFTLYLSLKDVDFDEALRLILKTAGLASETENGIHYVTKAPRIVAPPKTSSDSSAGHGAVKPSQDTHAKPEASNNGKPAVQKGRLSDTVLKKRVTTRFNKVDFRELMADLSRQTGVMIEVAEAVPAYKLDAYLLGTSLKYALDQITTAASLKWRFTDNYTIEIYGAAELKTSHS